MLSAKSLYHLIVYSILFIIVLVSTFTFIIINNAHEELQEKIHTLKTDYTNNQKELIKNLNKKKIPYQININKINLSNHTIYLLNNTKYNNENDNSIITYFTYQKYKFLYMGDASITTEDNLLENYNLNNISILKVGHHGSNTSSSKDFISQINPSISLISVGENNIYHHPNKEVINNLSKSRIYRTDINNMVKLTINSKGILKVTTIT